MFACFNIFLNWNYLFLLLFLQHLKICLLIHLICWWHFPLSVLFKFHFKFISVQWFISDSISLLNPTSMSWSIFIISFNCFCFHGLCLEYLFKTSLKSVNIFITEFLKFLSSISSILLSLGNVIVEELVSEGIILCWLLTFVVLSLISRDLKLTSL